MSRFKANPTPSLRPFVHSYWGLTRDLSEEGGFTVTPDCFPELIFFADPPLVEDTDCQTRLPACTLIGLLDRPLRLIAAGTMRCASVRLYAWSAGMVFPAVEKFPRRSWIDASAEFGDCLPTVMSALWRGEWAEIAPAFDAALRRAFSSPPPARAVSAARAFAAPPGDESGASMMQRVAEQQGRSRRQVERQVLSLTRLPPKRLSSLARFQFVRDTLWSRPETKLAELACDAGYADQSHMTRHFRRYAGQTPCDFLRVCARLKRQLRAQGVVFVQD